MTPPETTDDAIAEVLGALGTQAADERRGTDSFRSFEASDSIEQLVRRLKHATTLSILDAFDVLHRKFGLEKTHALYDYLHELPFRFRTYENAFNAETHVGCVDRAVAKAAAEIRSVNEVLPVGRTADPRHSRAGLATDGNGGVLGSLAVDALVLADQYDDSRRIQRLSVDNRAITARIIDGGLAGVSEEQVSAMVRLVQRAAADIAHEQDGLIL
jgi:hypothetical protein